VRAHAHQRQLPHLQVEEAGVWDEWVESAFNEIDTDASGSLDSSELRECGLPQGSPGKPVVVVISSRPPHRPDIETHAVCPQVPVQGRQLPDSAGG